VATDRETDLLSSVGDRSLRWSDRAIAAAELGRIRGDDHKAERVLRAVLAETPVNGGLHAPCLSALVHRAGESGLDVYLQELQSKSQQMRWAALNALAFINYDGEWDKQFDQLKRRLRRTQRYGNAWSYAYLILTGGEAERRNQLVALIRSRWDDLPEPDKHFLPNVWPGIEPGKEPGEPDTAVVRRWVSGTSS
jgi:hypothetical protein